MRIALVIPFAEGIAPMCNNEYFRAYVKQPEVEKIFWTGTCLPGETASDVVSGMASFVEAIKAAEKDGFDAVVVIPHPDSAVEEARELVRIPVLGPLQVGLHIGGILGRRVCVITPSQPLRRWIQYRTRAYGLEHMVTAREMGGMSVQELGTCYAEYVKSGICGEPLERVVSVAIKAIEEDDATVLTIGCGGMLWLVDPAREKLKEKGYDITFINPLPMAVEIAKSLVNMGLTHSRLCYPGYKWT